MCIRDSIEDIRSKLYVFFIPDAIKKYCMEISQYLDRIDDRRLLKVAWRYRSFGTSDVGKSREILLVKHLCGHLNVTGEENIA